jgi:hypothetical protein
MTDKTAPIFYRNRWAARFADKINKATATDVVVVRTISI